MSKIKSLPSREITNQCAKSNIRSGALEDYREHMVGQESVS